MLKIPYYEHYNSEKRIALLDNSAVSFMLQLDDKGHKPDVLLQGYDVVFLPEWVVAEIQDSERRVQYLERLVEEGIPVRIIKESFYSVLMNYEEIFLYEIVKAVVSKLGNFKRYFRMNIDKEDMLDMESYQDWIGKMYENWPLPGEPAESGRRKKKNAGEISIVILAEIFCWYYADTECLTIYTQDADLYVFQTYAEKELRKKEHLKDISPTEITYRSNDAILCQMYRDNLLTIREIGDIRKNARNVIYTLMRADNTTALITKMLDREGFTRLLQDKSAQIIF